MEQQNQTSPSELGDYVAILRRRKKELMVPIVVLFTLAVLMAWAWPPEYRATATITVKKEDIPADVVEPIVVSGYVQERIEKLSSQVLTDKTLLEVAERYNVYPDLEKGSPEVANRMYENIQREMVNIDIVNEKNSKPGTMTIAFTLSFDDADPLVAQKVTNALAEKFVSESRRSRTENATEVAAFLEKEAERLNDQLNEQEAKLAAFKREHAQELPELTPVNQNLLDTTQDQIAQAEQLIGSLEDQQIQLQAELLQLPKFASSDPVALAPSQALAALRSEYLRASAQYTPDHPDIQRIRRDIEALEGQTAAASQAAKIIGDLESKRQSLATLRTRYSEVHPDVRNLESAIAELKRELSSLRLNSFEKETAGLAATNPAYITKKAQLDRVNGSLKVERQRLGELRSKVAEYQQRLAVGPGVEKEYTALSRNYENARAKYNEIKSKTMQAQLAIQLESESKGEGFTLTRKANLPLSPIKPNKQGILLLGLFLGMVGGLGTLAVTEYRDDSIRGSKSVAAAIGSPPLAVIPPLPDHTGAPAEAEGITLQKSAVGLLLVGLVAAAVYMALSSPEVTPSATASANFTAIGPLSAS